MNSLRPSTSVTFNLSEKKAKKETFILGSPVEISPFNQGELLMDAYCTKMTKSIIMSSETISKPNNINEPTEKDFHKIKFLGKGKFGEVYLVMYLYSKLVINPRILCVR